MSSTQQSPTEAQLLQYFDTTVSRVRAQVERFEQRIGNKSVHFLTHWNPILSTTLVVSLGVTSSFVIAAAIVTLFFTSLFLCFLAVLQLFALFIFVLLSPAIISFSISTALFLVSTYFSLRFLVLLRSEGIRAAPYVWLAEVHAALFQTPLHPKNAMRPIAKKQEEESSPAQRERALTVGSSGSDDVVKVEGTPIDGNS
ncbi:hypothetical protein DL96DRAFT_1814393 [Flagelloscypha sp. PMI_526]|nr:hypothetical protein DL96DRAFT_1814393 [Flagelloscypha sp. PMI_526]